MHAQNIQTANQCAFDAIQKSYERTLSEDHGVLDKDKVRNWLNAVGALNNFLFIGIDVNPTTDLKKKHQPGFMDILVAELDPEKNLQRLQDTQLPANSSHATLELLKAFKELYQKPECS